MNNNKILITGVSGFIGRSLVEQVINNLLNYDIYGIDIKEPVFNKPEYSRCVNFEKIDICDKEAVDAYFDKHKFAGVIHLAAVSRVVDAEHDKDRCIAVNLHGTMNIVEAAAKNKDAWFIFGSSREVYGEQSILPVKETADKKPVNIYGSIKLKGEFFVRFMLDRYVILRFSNVYGNNYDIDGRVIPTFVKQAMNGETLFLEGGEQIIDFTYIDDTTQSIVEAIKLLESNDIQAEEIHISPGSGVKITDIIVYLEKKFGRKLDVQIRNKRDYDVVRFIGDSTKRMNILGDLHFKSVQEGIDMYIDSINN